MTLPTLSWRPGERLPLATLDKELRAAAKAGVALLK
jgi:hypothetical protein